MKKEKTLESFLREKLESELQTFGDGNTEFHTRDLEQLILILDDKDEKIRELEEQLSKTRNISISTDKDFLNNVLLSYRHDVGLLRDDSRENLLSQCKTWIEAINKNLSNKFSKSNKCTCSKTHPYGFVAGKEYTFEHRAFSIGVLNAEQKTWYNFHEDTSPDYSSSTDFNEYFK